MTDQASTLRLISSQRPSLGLTGGRPAYEMGTTTTNTIAAKRTRSIAVSAGKGGVGKSNFSVNLAIELGKMSKQVMLLDADFGLANADLLCGLSPKFHLGHVVSGVKDLEDIVLGIAENVNLVPGGSGIEELVNFSFATHAHTCMKLREMEQVNDFMIIDTAAGIGSNVLGVLTSASEVVIVATPEPTSVVDAYATIKVILKYAPKKPISVVVNSATSFGEANKVFVQLDSAASSFLNRRLNFLGMIPHDAAVPEAVREQIPLVEYAPEAPAARAIRLIAKQFAQQNPAGSDSQTESFWTAFTSN